MKKYYLLIILFLSIMVVDQSIALRQLGKFVELQNTIIDDYWALIGACGGKK